MKVVYVAGPYSSSEGSWGVEQNIQEARRHAKLIWDMGAAAICPHSNTAHMDGADGSACQAKFLAGTLEMCRRSDAVYLIPGWERSSGARAEKLEADARGIPVFETLWDLEDWLIDVDGAK